jgi:hypothetical protein
MRLTLDTSCVIDAAQAQPRGPQVDDLVDLARHGRVGLWITEAFTVDQETAPADRHQRLAGRSGPAIHSETRREAQRHG